MPEVSLKQCAHCKQSFPATSEFFYRHKGHRDGFVTRCKPCYGKDKKPRRVVAEGYKHCPGCKQDHPATLEYFHVCRSAYDDLTVYCKSCAHKKDVARYAKSKESEPKEQPPAAMACVKCKILKPTTIAFFTKNPNSRYGLSALCKDCINAAQRSNRQKKPDRLHYEHQYNATHREQNTARQKKWFQEGGNEIVKANTRNRRARIRQAEGKHTAQDIKMQYQRQKGKCYYCAKKLGASYHVDHVIPISRGGSNDPSNLVVACSSCNVSKNDRLPHEWPEGGRLL